MDGGLVAGGMLVYFISPNDYMQSYPWKFGVSYPIMLAVVLLASTERFSGLSAIFMTATIGAINIYLGARNYGGACLAAASYLLITLFLRRKRTESTKLSDSKLYWR